MAGPPEHVAPAELWAIVTQTPLPSRVVDHPRKFEAPHPKAGESICTLMLRVLTQEEMTLAKAEAAKSTLRVLRRSADSEDVAAKQVVEAMKRGMQLEAGLGEAYGDILKLESSIEILYRACRMPDDISRPFFPSPAAIRQYHTINEIGALMMTWLYLMEEASPIGDWNSDEEMEAWLVQLAKGGSDGHPLASRSHLALIRACLFMAKRLYGAASASS